MEDFTCAVVCLTNNANEKAPSRGYSSLVYWFLCVSAHLACSVGHKRFLQRKEQSNQLCWLRWNCSSISTLSLFGSNVGVLYRKLHIQSKRAPEDGRVCHPKHVELI